jgi:hypothetical protein
MDHRILSAVRAYGSDPCVAGAARALSCAGEHGARRGAWVRGTALIAGAHLAGMGVKRVVRGRVRPTSRPRCAPPAGIPSLVRTRPPPSPSAPSARTSSRRSRPRCASPAWSSACTTRRTWPRARLPEHSPRVSERAGCTGARRVRRDAYDRDRDRADDGQPTPQEGDAAGAAHAPRRTPPPPKRTPGTVLKGLYGTARPRRWVDLPARSGGVRPAHRRGALLRRRLLGGVRGKRARHLPGHQAAGSAPLRRLLRRERRRRARPAPLPRRQPLRGLGLTSPRADTVSGAGIGMALATVLRFWGTRTWVFRDEGRVGSWTG